MNSTQMAGAAAGLSMRDFGRLAEKRCLWRMICSGVFLVIPMACTTGKLSECPPQTMFAATCMAAARGDNQALLDIGAHYESGLVIAADPVKAARLYRRAAEDSPREFTMYQPPLPGENSGSVRRIPNANAQEGSIEAQFRLGRMYLEGRGVPRNEELARVWLTRAKRDGHEGASRLLATLSEKVGQ